MSVYQIEQYYISIDISEAPGSVRKKIERYLGDEGCSDYEFQDEENLIVDGFESESDAENIEHGIDAIIEGR